VLDRGGVRRRAVTVLCSQSLDSDAALLCDRPAVLAGGAELVHLSGLCWRMPARDLWDMEVPDLVWSLGARNWLPLGAHAPREGGIAGGLLCPGFRAALAVASLRLLERGGHGNADMLCGVLVGLYLGPPVRAQRAPGCLRDPGGLWYKGFRRLVAPWRPGAASAAVWLAAPPGAARGGKVNRPATSGCGAEERRGRAAIESCRLALGVLCVCATGRAARRPSAREIDSGRGSFSGLGHRRLGCRKAALLGVPSGWRQASRAEQVWHRAE